jgi:Domain of unknown function (DUF4265)
MEKVLFALNIDNGWPPVSSEGVWCERENGNYKLVNSPFFISGVAYGDVFEATPDEVNEQIFEFKVVKESGHSVVWMLNNKHIDVLNFIDAVKNLGCKVEEFQEFSLYSIDVPPNIDLIKFDGITKEYESKGLDFAYPAWRHEN